MTDTRSVSGSGDAHMHQQLYGRGGGADYTDDSILRVINAARLRDKSNSILRSTLSHVSRNTTSEDSDITETILKSVQKGDHANVRSYAETGDLYSDQFLTTGQGVQASQVVFIDAQLGNASAEAGNVNGNLVSVWSEMETGTLNAEQDTNARGDTDASQESNMSAERGSSNALAESSSGARANVTTGMIYGTLRSIQDSVGRAGLSFVFDDSEAVADGATTSASAESAEGDEAGINVDVKMDKGNFSTSSTATGDDDMAFVAHDSAATKATRGDAKSYAKSADGDLAGTRVSADMTGGNFVMVMDAEAGSAFVSHYTHATNATCGDSSSYAKRSDNNRTGTNVAQKINVGG